MKIDYYIGMGIMYTGAFIFMLALFDGGKGMGLVAIGGCKVMIDARLGE